MIKAAKIIHPQLPKVKLTKFKIHGHARRLYRSQEFRAWDSMKSRCLNPKDASYKNYGGRGVEICEHWIGKASFVNFIFDLGKKPSKSHSLDRINNSGNYSCGKCDECLRMGWILNVKWSTKLEQSNNRRSNVLLEHNGIRLTQTEWAKRIGIKLCTLDSRLERWSVAKSLETPVKNKSRRPVFSHKLRCP